MPVLAVGPPVRIEHIVQALPVQEPQGVVAAADCQLPRQSAVVVPSVVRAGAAVATGAPALTLGVASEDAAWLTARLALKLAAGAGGGTHAPSGARLTVFAGAMTAAAVGSMVVGSTGVAVGASQARFEGTAPKLASCNGFGVPPIGLPP